MRSARCGWIYRPASASPATRNPEPSGRRSRCAPTRRCTKPRPPANDATRSRADAELNVIAGLVPAISLGRALCLPHRDGRNKSGHGDSQSQPKRKCSSDFFTPAPRCRSPPAATVEEPQNDQEQERSDGRRDDGGDDAGAEMNAQSRQQPAADEGADNPNADIGDDAETGAANDLPGEPPGDETDQQDDEKAFPRHGMLPLSLRARCCPSRFADAMAPMSKSQAAEFMADAQRMTAGSRPRRCLTS